MHKTGKETEPVMGPVGQTLPGLAFPNMELEQNSSCTDLYRIFRCSSCMPALWRHFQYNISKPKRTNIRLRTYVRVGFFSSAISILQTLVSAIGAGLGVWGVINLLEGYGNDNPGAKSQGIKQLMAGGGVILIGTQLVPQLSGLFG